jgi:hypothetical protein
MDKDSFSHRPIPDPKGRLSSGWWIIPGSVLGTVLIWLIVSGLWRLFT